MPLSKREQNSRNWRELKRISNGQHKARWNMKNRHLIIAEELSRYRTIARNRLLLAGFVDNKILKLRELERISNNYNHSTINSTLEEIKNEINLFNMINDLKPDSKEREIKFSMDIKEAKNIILENVDKKITDPKLAIRILIAANVLGQTYNLAFVFGGNKFMNINKQSKTLVYIRMVMDDFSEDYSGYFESEGSDGKYFNDFENYGSPILKRYEKMKAPDKDGGYFAFSNTTDIDLEDLQIYDASCNGDQEHCIIFALEQDNTCTKQQINAVKLAIPKTNLKKRDLAKIADILKRQIIVSLFIGNMNRIRKMKYGNLNNKQPIQLALYKSHYFINKDYPISKYFANNYELLKDEKDREQIIQRRITRNGNESFSYKKSKISAILLVHCLFKQKLFTPRASTIQSHKTKQDEPSYLGNIEYIMAGQQSPLIIPEPEDYLKENISLFFGDTETDVNGDNHEILLSGIIDMDSKESHITTNFYNTLRYIVSKTKLGNVAHVYYHNLKYDKAVFDKYVYILSSVEKANSVYSFTCSFQKTRIKFIDSNKLLACPLSKFHKMFNLDIEKEGGIGYTFYKSGSDYSNVSVNEYIQHLKQNEIKSFINKITTNPDFKYDCIAGTFDAMRYYKHYLNLDCLVLREGLKAFNECVKKITNDRLTIFYHDINTSASLGHKLALINGCYDGVFTVSGNLREYISSAIYGGRVNPNKKYVKKVLEVKGGIADYDGVSLYPSAMYRLCQEYGIPIGWAKKFDDKIPDDANYYVCTILLKKINKKQDNPFISIKTPSGINYVNEIDEPIKITIDRYTLEDWIEFHKIDYDMLYGVYWNQGFNKKLGQSIKDLFEQRKVYKKAKNEGMQQSIKLILNSTYGKTILKKCDKEITYKKSDQKGLDYIIKNWNTIEKFYDNGKQYHITMSKVDISHNMGHIGCAILSMSKRIMNEVQNTASDNNLPIYYQDTDSIHMNNNQVAILEQKYYEKYNRVLTGKDLGQFHVDFSMKAPVESIVARRSIFLGKKAYIDELVGYDKDGKEYIEYHQRMKGINTIALAVKAEEYGNPFEFYRHIATTTEKEKMVLNPLGTVSFEYKEGKVRSRTVGEFVRWIKY